MDDFSYLSVLISIIIGIGITQLLTWLARWVENRFSFQVFTPTIIWVFILLIVHIETWWGMYSLRHIHHWTLFQFIAVLLKPIILFLLTIIVHPNSTSENLDLKFNYFLQRRWFFSLLISLLLVNVLIDIVMSESILVPHVLFFYILSFTTVISGLIFENEKYHRFLAYFAAVTLGFYIIQYFWILQ